MQRSATAERGITTARDRPYQPLAMPVVGGRITQWHSVNRVAARDNVSVTGPSPVPEPATLGLVGLGGLGLLLIGRKRKVV